ncbi:MAG: SAM-dependent chlorinase/fluorinase [Thermoleophilia bacterium]|nr:SAM-dependent chlorinase/fluorinase [Thermoleophilia bacterium]
MSGLGIITFISDTGWGGGYAAVCEAIVARLKPQARVFHISHEVPVGDIAAGALTLGRIAPLYPPAVHVAIVDPGVGTGRQAIALCTARGDVLVGPDNGVLIPAAEALGGLTAAWVLDPVRVRAKAGLPVGDISSTFHGRDIFAPTATILATDADPAPIATPLDPSTLVRLQEPFAEATFDGATAEVIEVDRFGNVGLALSYEALVPLAIQYLIEVVGEGMPEWNARVVRTYGDLRPGELGVFRDSWGQVAIALNSASAAQLLSLNKGMRVRLTSVPEPPPADSAA